MAEKKERKFLKDFGGEADDEFFQQFGGFIKGNNEKKKDPVKLQELDAFTQGWQAACEQGNKLPVMEEMNGLFYLFGYFIKYLYQEGIPEWNAEETYYEGSVVKHEGYLYKAVYENVDGFSGLPEPSSSSAKPFWAELSFKNLVAERLTAGSAKITGTDPGTELSLDVTGNANINGKLTVVADGLDITGSNEFDSLHIKGETSSIETSGTYGLVVDKQARIHGDLIVDGNVTLNTSKTIFNASDVDINSGSVNFSGDLYSKTGFNPDDKVKVIDNKNQAWVGKIFPTNGGVTDGYLKVDSNGRTSKVDSPVSMTKELNYGDNLNGYWHYSNNNYRIRARLVKLTINGKNCSFCYLTVYLVRNDNAFTPTSDYRLFDLPANFKPNDIIEGVFSIANGRDTGRVYVAGNSNGTTSVYIQSRHTINNNEAIDFSLSWVIDPDNTATS